MFFRTVERKRTRTGRERDGPDIEPLSLINPEKLRTHRYSSAYIFLSDIIVVPFFDIEFGCLVLALNDQDTFTVMIIGIGK